mmetsp:Transcript_97050/g.296625  ORF Transcript_97050/g.296625 Transcript_97050/m.296625 type:complete len:208 (+) Transcript_97050:627-1250(+)
MVNNLISATLWRDLMVKALVMACWTSAYSIFCHRFDNLSISSRFQAHHFRHQRCTFTTRSMNLLSKNHKRPVICHCPRQCATRLALFLWALTWNLLRTMHATISSLAQPSLSASSPWTSLAWAATSPDVLYFFSRPQVVRALSCSAADIFWNFRLSSTSFAKWTAHMLTNQSLVPPALPLHAPCALVKVAVRLRIARLPWLDFRIKS